MFHVRDIRDMERVSLGLQAYTKLVTRGVNPSSVNFATDDWQGVASNHQPRRGSALHCIFTAVTRHRSMFVYHKVQVLLPDTPGLVFYLGAWHDDLAVLLAKIAPTLSGNRALQGLNCLPSFCGHEGT